MISAMRSRWPAHLSEPLKILIAALSGRALAQAARLSGFAPLVADFFGDADLAALAHGTCQLAGDFSAGFQKVELVAALETLSRGHAPLGLVCGTGFEDRPALLATLGRRWHLLGNAPQLLAQLKNPMQFAALCMQAHVPHPESQMHRPDNMSGWLVKQAGGSGGGHVASSAADTGSGKYYQRLAQGLPVSLLVLADGQACRILGTSQQWAAPTPQQPFRYGGAVRPAMLSSAQDAALSEAVARMMSALVRQAAPSTGLKGLNSFDFLVSETGFSLLEINPRPGATLDIFTHAGLFQAHIDACNGQLRSQKLAFADAQAAALLYAERDIAAWPADNWPDWLRDRPKPGTCLPCGTPVCTIVASGADAKAARHLLDQRLASMRRDIADILEL